MSNNNAEWGEETPAQTGAGAAEGSQHETGEPNVLAVVEALNAENGQLKDRVLRTLAEMENLRRRTEREVSDA
ncbi:MAG TPA: nucleotide exchange factor GrpE, partial [Roseiarcus sp.]|nr:nucleotide exchange factor GrpE [Roseiarcus sp.]